MVLRVVLLVVTMIGVLFGWYCGVVECITGGVNDVCILGVVSP